MQPNPPSGDPYEAQIAADSRVYRQGLLLIASIILLIAPLALLTLAARTNLIPAWLSNGLMTGLFLSWLAYVFLRLKPGHPPPSLDAADEEYLRKSIDYQQRRSRRYLTILLWNLFYMSYMYTLFTHIFSKKHPEGALQTILLATFAGIVCVIALLTVLTLAYGGGRDELSRAQRAKAAQFGHILAVIELGALLLTSIFHPQWALTALPWTIVIAIALPGAYFIHLELWPGRG